MESAWMCVYVSYALCRHCSEPGEHCRLRATPVQKANRFSVAFWFSGLGNRFMRHGGIRDFARYAASANVRLH